MLMSRNVLVPLARRNK
uniref:Uncharacterized protein n=1 Tax=Arundo donax TaxID=35708 RepID=A0A0A9B6C5_ARUDO